MPPARLILLCSIAYQHFLQNQERKVQTVIAGSSSVIRGRHPSPTSLITIFANPSCLIAESVPGLVLLKVLSKTDLYCMNTAIGVRHSCKK
jgi:hypothetical protein